MDFDKNLFLKTLEELATSKGPSLEEDPRIALIHSFLNKENILFKNDQAKNIIIPLKEIPGVQPLVFDAHIDVAGKGYSNEFHIGDKKISGQGCADDLTAAVMLLMLAKEIPDKDIKKPFYILLSTGEEGKGNLGGIKNFVSQFHTKPELFVSFDLSFDTISLSGLGSRRIMVEVSTPGGHSYEDFGTPNSAEIICEIIYTLKNKIKDSELKDSITFNTGRISGGSEINLIPDHAEAWLEFRSLEAELLDKAEDLLKNIISGVVSSHIQISTKDTGSRPGAQGINKEKILKKISPVFKRLNINPEIKPMSTNINVTLSHGWESFCTGLCSCGNFHTEEEFVIKSSLEKGWNLLVGLIDEFGIL